MRSTRRPTASSPAADKLKLPIQTAQGITRTAGPAAKGPLASPKFLEALFKNDVLRNKKNTEAVDAGASQLISARVVNYSPAATQPLAEVSARVKEKLVARQAAALARSLLHAYPGHPVSQDLMDLLDMLDPSRPVTS